MIIKVMGNVGIGEGKYFIEVNNFLLYFDVIISHAAFCRLLDFRPKREVYYLASCVTHLSTA